MWVFAHNANNINNDLMYRTSLYNVLVKEMVNLDEEQSCDTACTVISLSSIIALIQACVSKENKQYTVHQLHRICVC